MKENKKLFIWILFILMCIVLIGALSYIVEASHVFSPNRNVDYKDRFNLTGVINASFKSVVINQIEVCLEDGTNCPSGIIDTNETARFIELTAVNCAGTDKMIGVFTNGTVQCDADVGAGAVSNETDLIVFTNNTQNITIKTGYPTTLDGLANLTRMEKITFLFSGFLRAISGGWLETERLNATLELTVAGVNVCQQDGTNCQAQVVDTNETVRFIRLVDVNCAVGELMRGVFTNGTVDCVTDQTGAGITDTNETIRFGNLTEFDCPVGQTVNGVHDNGTVACIDDINFPDTNETIFVLNLTDTDCPPGSLVIGAEPNGTFLCAIDDTGSSIVDTNETVRMLNLTGFDCPAGFLVIGVELNGTVLCAADADSGGAFDGNVSSICSNGETLLGEDTTLCIPLNTTIDDRYRNGSGISLQNVGSFIELNHTDTSNQASSDNSGNTFIQDILLDTFGHITSIVVALVEITNIFDQDLNMTSDVTFNNITANGFFGGNGTFIKSLDCNNIVGQDSDFCVDADTITVDTNETVRFIELTVFDCVAGEVVNGVFVNGTVSCVTDADTITIDTNATTACADDEHLDGSGGCFNTNQTTLFRIFNLPFTLTSSVSWTGSAVNNFTIEGANINVKGGNITVNETVGFVCLNTECNSFITNNRTHSIWV